MKKNTLINIVVIIGILALGIFGSWYLSKQQTKSQQSLESNQIAVITNSGSTNFSGYKIIINKDGSGSIQKSNINKSFSKGTFDAVNLQNTLNKLGDMSKITVGHCKKSVSFGSLTKITYHGKTSGD